MKKEEEEEYYYEEEEFIEDIEYVQASTLTDLRKKILKKLDEGGTIEQNPFWDPKNEQWVQTILYYNSDEEEV